MTDEHRKTDGKLRLADIARIMAVFVAAIWIIEIVDASLLEDRLEAQGIFPRRLGGLDGVLWAPFLHDDFIHLIANSVPLAVLGGIVLLRGLRGWLRVSAVIIIAGGLVTWLAARSGNHIGASGLVFGYLGFLLAAAYFERSFRAIVTAVIVFFVYGSLLIGVLPVAPGVSWESHLFGALAGVGVAFFLAKAKR